MNCGTVAVHFWCGMDRWPFPTLMSPLKTNELNCYWCGGQHGQLSIFLSFLEPITAALRSELTRREIHEAHITHITAFLLQNEDKQFYNGTKPRAHLSVLFGILTQNPVDQTTLWECMITQYLSQSRSATKSTLVFIVVCLFHFLSLTQLQAIGEQFVSCIHLRKVSSSLHIDSMFLYSAFFFCLSSGANS